MITSLGPSELGEGLGLAIGGAVVVGVGVDDAGGCDDGLVATSELRGVGEEREPAGLA